MTGFFLHNTLSGRRELFVPQDAARITMYVCGPTVYGPVHVGNARPAVVFDVLFRLLRRLYGEQAAVYARNITDIDDKIINAAQTAGEDPAVLASRWRDAYAENMRHLHVLPPTMEPHATGHIPQIVTMIERLIRNGNAYAASDHVLFNVPSYADYGALSNRRREEMLAGARVEVAPYKKNAADFVLWKPSAESAPGWESPWGRGRPGWHIECSAMAAACLGEQIDLHGGGQDLIFPHHENEIAQSCCVHGGKTFARYWMHNGHINMDGEKMSKSLANTRLLADALRLFPGEAVRYALLSAHYRKPLNWTEKLLEDAKTALDRLYRAVDGAAAAADADEAMPVLADDLNVPQVFSLMHELARDINKSGDSARTARLRGKLSASGRLLGFFNASTDAWFRAQTTGGLSDAAIADMIVQRRQARQRRDFAAADAVRKQLAEQGVVLEDSAEETTWRRE